MYTDEDYIGAVHRGDETIFTAMVHVYLDRLTKFAFGCVPDEDTAHDVVQEVFARIWQLGVDWKPHSGVSPYLFGAVRHRAYNALAALRARERLQQAVQIENEVDLRDDPYLDIAAVAAVRQELAQLTDRQRDALRLRYQQGHTVAEAAKVLGIDVRGTERLIARGIARLRARLHAFRKNAE